MNNFGQTTISELTLLQESAAPDQAVRRSELAGLLSGTGGGPVLVADITDFVSGTKQVLGQSLVDSISVTWIDDGNEWQGLVRVKTSGGLDVDDGGVFADFGTLENQVARGNHTHAQLHDPVTLSQRPFGAPVIEVGVDVTGNEVGEPRTVTRILLRDTPVINLTQATIVDGITVGSGPGDAGTEVVVVVTPGEGGGIPGGAYLVDAENGGVAQGLAGIAAGAIFCISAGVTYAGRFFRLRDDGGFEEVFAEGSIILALADQKLSAQSRLDPLGGIKLTEPGIGVDYGSGTNQVARGAHSHALLHNPVTIGSTPGLSLGVNANQVLSGTVQVDGAPGVGFSKIVVGGGGIKAKTGTAVDEAAPGNHSHAVVTSGTDGFMSKVDKVRIDTQLHNPITIGATPGLILGVSATQQLSGTVQTDANPSSGFGKVVLGGGGLKVKLGTAVDESAAGNHSHATATFFANGFMSASDKEDFDGMMIIRHAPLSLSSNPTPGLVFMLDALNQQLSGTVQADPAPGAGFGKIVVGGGGIKVKLGTSVDDSAPGNHTHAVVTSGTAGFMSTVDKIRLDAMTIRPVFTCIGDNVSQPSSADTPATMNLSFIELNSGFVVASNKITTVYPGLYHISARVHIVSPDTGCGLIILTTPGLQVNVDVKDLPGVFNSLSGQRLLMLAAGTEISVQAYSAGSNNWNNVHLEVLMIAKS